MKRNLQSVQVASPDSSVPLFMSANAPKRKEDNEPSTSLSMDGYWEEKAKKLQNPFADQMSQDVREVGKGIHGIWL